MLPLRSQQVQQSKSIELYNSFTPVISMSAPPKAPPKRDIQWADVSFFRSALHCRQAGLCASKLFANFVLGSAWNRVLSRRSSSWIRSIRQTANIVFKPSLLPHTPRLPVTAGGRVPRRHHILHHVGIRVFNKAAQTRACRQARGGQEGHRQQRLSTNAEAWRPCHPCHNHKLAFVSYGGV